MSGFNYSVKHGLLWPFTFSCATMAGQVTLVQMHCITIPAVGVNLDRTIDYYIQIGRFLVNICICLDVQHSYFFRFTVLYIILYHPIHIYISVCFLCVCVCLGVYVRVCLWREGKTEIQKNKNKIEIKDLDFGGN